MGGNGGRPPRTGSRNRSACRSPGSVSVSAAIVPEDTEGNWRRKPRRRSRADNPCVAGTLYLVGTPIGNLGDLTDRARQTLAAVDLVAAEDTRRTGRLLSGLGIKARMLSFFEGNEEERIHELLSALAGGADVAVVSDAGMPGLSDPGYRLVAACVEAGIAVDVIPGPSAVVSALVVSGLPTDRFVFEGFLPRSGKA